VGELLGNPRLKPRPTLAALEHLLQTNPTRQRAGRQFARKKRSAAHRLRFAKYAKRVLAYLNAIAPRRGGIVALEMERLRLTPV
jgi:hypothetical protein